VGSALDINDFFTPLGYINSFGALIASKKSLQRQGLRQCSNDYFHLCFFFCQSQAAIPHYQICTEQNPGNLQKCDALIKLVDADKKRLEKVSGTK
jgi:hypothetical protein